MKTYNENIYWELAKKLEGETLYTPGRRIPFKVITVSDDVLKIARGSGYEQPFSRKLLEACCSEYCDRKRTPDDWRKAGIFIKKRVSYLPAIVFAICALVKSEQVGSSFFVPNQSLENSNRLSDDSAARFESFWTSAKKLEGRTFYTLGKQKPFNVIEVSETSLKVERQTGTSLTYKRERIEDCCNRFNSGKITADDLNAGKIVEGKKPYSYLPAIVYAILKDCQSQSENKMEASMSELEDLNSRETFDEEDSGDEPLDLSEEKRKIYLDTPKIRISDLHNQYKKGKLIVRPGFQRGFVWNIRKASKLIESILINVPIPMIYSAEEKDGKEIIVDGQQRLLSIFSYIDGTLPPENTSFSLTGVLEEFKGLKFSELKESHQDQIYNYSIPFTVIKKDSAEEIKFDIFERLNTGAEPLNDQELRNCIYRGRYNNFLRSLSEKNEDFQLLINNPKFHTRMLDCELILRFFAFYHKPYWEYRSPVKRFLNEEIEKRKNINDNEIHNLTEVFKNAVDLTKIVFGKHAFRRFVLGKDENHVNGEHDRIKFNKGLFTILMVGFTKYSKNQVIPFSDALREELLWLQTYDIDFIDAISGTGTDDTDKTQIKFKIWFESLKEILGDQKKEPRYFSESIKEQLFNNSSYCAICNQTIMNFPDDAEVDHIDFYWRGGKTIPSNARLVHRYCNRARRWKENPPLINDKKMRVIMQSSSRQKKD